MLKYVVAVLAVLVFASQAQAGQFGPSRPFGPAEEAAFVKAELYWGAQPVNCVSLTKEVVSESALAGPDAPNGASGRATQPFGPSSCGLWIAEGLNQHELCNVMRHEYGHLLGYSHQDPELANMPGCAFDSAQEADGGIYIPDDPEEIRRHQNWEELREWRASCYREPRRSKNRVWCFRAVRRYNARLHSIWR